MPTLTEQNDRGIGGKFLGVDFHGVPGDVAYIPVMSTAFSGLNEPDEKA